MVRANLTIGDKDKDNGAPTIYGDIDMKNALSVENIFEVSEGSITCSSTDVPVLKFTGNVAATITGGTFKAEGDAGTKNADVLELYLSKSKYATATIEGGTFIANKTNGFYTTQAGCTTTVSGGYFYSSTASKPFFSAKNATALEAFSVSGGYYNTDNIGYNAETSTSNNDCIKSGHTIKTVKKTVGDYTFTKQVEKIMVAEIVDGSQYGTVEEAFAAAEAGNTIKLLESSTLASAISVDKELTLDLNGQVLTEDGKYRINVVSSGDLTIDDKSAETVKGTIVNSASNSNILTITSGKCTLSTGSLYTNSTATGVTVSTDGTFNVEGGTVANEGTGAAIKCTATTGQYNISKTNTSEPYVYGSVDKTKGTCSITAGYFSSEFTPDPGYEQVSVSGSTTATVKLSESNKDLTFTKHVEAIIVAEIVNGNQYGTVEAAFTAAEAGDKIKLLRSSTLASAIPVDKELTLDLNGQVLTEEGTNRINVSSGGDLTIDDSSEGEVKGTLYNNSAKSNIMVITSGTCTLKAGSLYTSSSANGVSVSSSGTFNVEGGIVANAGTSNAIRCAKPTGKYIIKKSTDDSEPYVYGGVDANESEDCSITAGYFSVEVAPDSGYKQVTCSKTATVKLSESNKDLTFDKHVE